MHHPVKSALTRRCHHSAWPHTHTHTHTPIFTHPAATGWFIPRQQRRFDGCFHFRADESATVMWGNECFVHRLPPSTQIDGACNWWPLCVIAKINRHCCGHGRSMSRTKQAPETERGREGWIYGPSYSASTYSKYLGCHTLLQVLFDQI